MFYGVFNDRLPNRFLVGFFDADAFGAKKTKDPLICSDLDLRNVKVYINGTCIKDTHINYNEHKYMDVYMNFLRFLNAEAKPFYLSFTDFKEGYRFYTVDLRFDSRCKSEMHCIGAPVTRGRLDLSISLGGSLPQDIVMLVFGFCNEQIHIDKHRVAKFCPTIS